MDKKFMSICNALAKGAGTAISAVGQFAMDCKAQGDYMDAQRSKAYHQQVRAEFQQRQQHNFDVHTDVLGRCLQRNYEQCGLFCPKYPEELQCDDVENNIDGDESNIIFRNEVEREPIGANVHTISQRTVKRIPVEVIEKRLRAQLPKYAASRGYGFTHLSVIDTASTRATMTTSPTSSSARCSRQE